MGSTRTIISKGSIKTTTLWIWALHADAHDFGSSSKTGSSSNTGGIKHELSRKVFSSNLAHLSLVLFWISGMHFHGAYFSNYSAWIKGPLEVSPTSQYVWEVVSQGALNAELGGFRQGLYITSGLFNIWITQGIVSLQTIKGIALVGLLGSGVILAASYFHMHISIQQASGGVYKKLKTVLPHHLSIMLGMGSLSWSGHEFHITNITLKMLECGIEPGIIPSGHELLSRGVFYSIYQEAHTDFSVNSIALYIGGQAKMNSYWCSLEPTIMACHHYMVGLVLILPGISAYGISARGAKSKFS